MNELFKVQFVLDIEVGPFHKSYNATVPYPKLHPFVAEMCICVHISVTKWCIVGYLPDALCGL